jgi:hypothetical protein
MPKDAMGNDNRGNNAKIGASRIFLEIHWEEEDAINKRTAKLVESALIVRLAMFTTGQGVHLTVQPSAQITLRHDNNLVGQVWPSSNELVPERLVGTSRRWPETAGPDNARRPTKARCLQRALDAAAALAHCAPPCTADTHFAAFAVKLPASDRRWLRPSFLT